ncbi:MAG: putative oxidoreductase, partial [Nocardioidaceae bacterium]|nr:putative oxidoreductase [Nocardioidaceae bacterium]
EHLAAEGAEAVSISTPASTHSSLTDTAIELGMSVVCDKPFALNALAARHSVELAEASDVVLSPYQNRRWDSEFLTIQTLVANGSLGEVRRLESRFERFAPERGPGASGGGTLTDFCSHLVDQALVLLGPVESVYAEFRLLETGLDDDVFVALRHANGARSHIWGNWQQHAPGPRFRVTGTNGSLILTTADTQEDSLIAGIPEVTSAGWGSEAVSDRDTLFTAAGSAIVPLERGSWDTYYPAFARAVRGLGPSPVNAWDAVDTAIVLDAAHLSASTGKTVDITPAERTTP